MYIVIFFFFQAEDGIRDGRVTGVQTCALPICIRVALNGLTVRAARALDGVITAVQHTGNAAAQLLDGARDVDPVPVDRQGEIGDEAWCEHRADGDRVGRLGREIRVASPRIGDVGIGLYPGGEEVGRLHALRLADGRDRGRLLRAIAGARVVDDGEIGRRSTVELADIGRADGMLILAAEPDILGHAPEAATRVGPDAADTFEVVVGIPERRVD